MRNSISSTKRNLKVLQRVFVWLRTSEMWSTFLFLFTLKSFITVGDTYPITSSDIELSRDNNIMTSINDSTGSVMPYTCVYIPSNLEFCKFSSYKSRENLWNSEFKLSENKKNKRKLLKNNKIYFMSHPSMPIPETNKLQKQSFVKTIIYEIQRCVPPRLPFVLPWCTDEDLSDKKSEIYRLYPFMRDGLKATYEFPV